MPFKWKKTKSRGSEPRPLLSEPVPSKIRFGNGSEFVQLWYQRYVKLFSVLSIAQSHVTQVACSRLSGVLAETGQWPLERAQQQTNGSGENPWIEIRNGDATSQMRIREKCSFNGNLQHQSNFNFKPDGNCISVVWYFVGIVQYCRWSWNISPGLGCTIRNTLSRWGHNTPYFAHWKFLRFENTRIVNKYAIFHDFRPHTYPEVGWWHRVPNLNQIGHQIRRHLSLKYMRGACFTKTCATILFILILRE